VLNVGYGKEHHDLTCIPWGSLPEPKALAAEYFQPLKAHQS